MRQNFAHELPEVRSWP